jgi:YgiT-type zinc finger domain-containing protein
MTGDDHLVYSCPNCQVGILKPRLVIYFSVQKGQVINVPGFPAWVCDICKYREYDPNALAELQTILESNPRMQSAFNADTGHEDQKRSRSSLDT